MLSIRTEPNTKPHQTITSLRSFWTYFWLLISEIAVITFHFIIILLTPSQQQQDEHHDIMFYIIYFGPSISMIILMLTAMLSLRGNRGVNVVMFIGILISFLWSVSYVGYLFIHFIEYVETIGCYEFHEWDWLSLDVIKIVLFIWPLFFRFGALVQSLQLLRHSDYVSENFDRERSMCCLKGIVKGITAVVTVCCTPVFCVHDLMKASLHKQHIVHHVIQLVYEIVLLVFALVEHKNIEMLSIIAGLLASLIGLVDGYYLDILLNIFSLILGIFILTIDIVELHCLEIESIQSVVYLFMFSVIANFIRLKSIFHSLIEYEESTWKWLQDQKEWIKDSEGKWKHAALFKVPFKTKNDELFKGLKSILPILAPLSVAFIIISIVVLILSSVFLSQYWHIFEILGREQVKCQIEYNQRDVNIDNNLFKIFSKVSISNNTQLVALGLKEDYFYPVNEEQADELEELYEIGSNHTCLIPYDPVSWMDFIWNVNGYTSGVFNSNMTSVSVIGSQDDYGVVFIWLFFGFGVPSIVMLICFLVLFFTVRRKMGRKEYQTIN